MQYNAMQCNAMHVTCYMSHITHVTCHKYQVANNFNKDPVCHIFLESPCSIHFNGYDKNVAYHMCYMSHVTHVTCHKHQLTKKYTKDSVCHIFMDSSCKIKFNGHNKKHCMSHVLHVTCHTCYMSQISSCKQFYERPCVLYIFGKVMQNTVQWS